MVERLADGGVFDLPASLSDVFELSPAESPRSQSLGDTSIQERPQPGIRSRRKRKRQLPSSGGGQGGNHGDDGDDDSGGGGGGDGFGGRWNEDGWFGDEDPSTSPSTPDAGETTTFAFLFFLTSIATLFLIFVGAYVVLRKDQTGTTAIPTGLWINTAVILASSWPMHLAVQNWRAQNPKRARHWLSIATYMGLLFLMLQARTWWQTYNSGLVVSKSAFGSLFYALTGLHAIHVAGGLPFFLWLTWRSRKVEESPAWGLPLRLGSIYWHFIGAVWLILFGLLLLR